MVLSPEKQTQQNKNKGTALRLLALKTVFVKLTPLWSASVSVVQTQEHVSSVAPAPPAYPICEGKQSNEKSWEFKSFCLKAAIAFTFTVCFLVRVCMGFWLNCYL